MTQDLIPISRCAEISGLRSHEMVLGVTPSLEHERLLANYQFEQGRVRQDARVALVADIRAAVAVGASRRAADLLVVLRRLLALREPIKQRGASAARRGRHCGARARSRVTRDATKSERRQAPQAAAGPARDDNVFSLDAFRRARRNARGPSV